MGREEHCRDQSACVQRSALHALQPLVARCRARVPRSIVVLFLAGKLMDPQTSCSARLLFALLHCMSAGKPHDQDGVALLGHAWPSRSVACVRPNNQLHGFWDPRRVESAVLTRDMEQMGECVRAIYIVKVAYGHMHTKQCKEMSSFFLAPLFFAFVHLCTFDGFICHLIFLATHLPRLCQAQLPVVVS